MIFCEYFDDVDFDQDFCFLTNPFENIRDFKTIEILKSHTINF